MFPFNWVATHHALPVCPYRTCLGPCALGHTCAVHRAGGTTLRDGWQNRSLTLGLTYKQIWVNYNISLT